MSLLSLLASGGGGVVTPPPPTDTTPYEFPTVAPYNVPAPFSSPLGEVVHPSVIDFQTQHGQATWNGHRYWLAITPYPGGGSGAENPCIQVSSDGFTWTTPAGLTNPIDPAPGATGYNSDTDLVYDPDTGRLWCYWREHNYSVSPNLYILHAAWSTNGSAWTTINNVLVTTANDTYTVLSPCVTRLGTGQWRMFSCSGPSWWTATDPAGPWTLVGAVTATWSGSAAQTLWHAGITRVGGTYLSLWDINGPSTQAVFAAASTDGQAWNVAGATPVIDVGASGDWDLRPYRACLTPHENGTHARVWYSASNSATPPYQWYTGYTQVPLTAWPAPPA